MVEKLVIFVQYCSLFVSLLKFKVPAYLVRDCRTFNVNYRRYNYVYYTAPMSRVMRTDNQIILFFNTSNKALKRALTVTLKSISYCL